MPYTPLTATETHTILWSRGIALPISLLSLSFRIVAATSWRSSEAPRPVEVYLPLLIPVSYEYIHEENSPQTLPTFC
jgi:hypothetical protein